MVKSNPITAFVNDLLNIEADLILEPLVTDEVPARVVKMAADAPNTMTLSAARVGSMADPDNQMLARVFKDETDRCFRLFLLSSTDKSPAFILLTIPDHPHFFVADANGQIEIPYATEINPLEVVFNLNFPFQVLEMETFTPENKSLIKENFNFHLENGESQFSIEISPSASIEDKDPTKLFFRAAQANHPFIRLIPIRDRRAVIHFDESVEFTSAITVCTFA